MSNKCITCCNYDLSLDGPRVIRWDDPGGLSTYNEDEIEEFEESRKTGKITKKVTKGKRYKLRNIADGDWETLAKSVDKFVVHHSVTYRSKDTFNGLNGRGLSVTFMIDDDADKNGFATIHQCLDMRDIAYATGGINDCSVGVEIALMPQYWDNPYLYSEKMQKIKKVTSHEITYDTINGHRFKCFKPTDAQVKSLIYLISGVAHILPDMPRTFPKKNGKYIKKPLDDYKNYTGVLNHFNCSKIGKVDCMGLDLKYIEKEVDKLWND